VLSAHDTGELVMQTRTRRFFLIPAAALLISVALAPAWASDTAPAKPDNLSAARALIEQKKWDGAIAELKRVNDTGSADWNNLMGYSLRKGPSPDLAAAEKFYNEALRIDPKHRGALEYSGQLYLMMGDLSKAEQRLATLDKVCTFSCEEYSDLKKAVARYKSNGNKYVAGS
jgi:tetratricopeptide (TPR) repeat protein